MLRKFYAIIVIYIYVYMCVHATIKMKKKKKINFQSFSLYFAKNKSQKSHAKKMKIINSSQAIFKKKLSRMILHF